MTPTIDHILCGVDLDDPVPAAIQFAHRLASATGATLEVIGNLDSTSAERSPDLLAEVHLEALRDLADLDPDLATHHETVTSGLAEALTDRARTTPVDIVVVGAHPSDGTTPLGLGGLAHGLAHHLDCPIAAVPTIGGPLRHGTYIVGVDGSDASRRALDWTRALAQATEARCCAVYSIEDIYDTFNSHGWYGSEERTARETIDQLADVELVERTAGDPADTLNQVAGERDAAAIVVAARQRHALGGLLLGMVPDHLLHHPRWPTVVIPHATVKAGAR